MIRKYTWKEKCIFVLTVLNFTKYGGAKNEKTNFVVLLADDLGQGDIGCFGNTTIPTPNIDRLCNEGIKFTHHLATAALCTPSRAAFLTGRYAARMGLAKDSDESPPVVVYVSGRAGLPETEYTWAKLLRDHGYSTAMTGKWHLGWDKDSYGDNLHGPLGHGFETFFGLPFTFVDGFESDTSFWTYNSINDSNAKNTIKPVILALIVVLAVYSKDVGYLIFALLIVFFFMSWFLTEHFSFLEYPGNGWWQRSVYMEKYLNSMIMFNTTIVEQPIRLEGVAGRLTDKSIEFIETNAASEIQKPFGLLHSFTNVHTPLITGKEFRSKASQNHGAYGDSVIEMDHQVGRILKTLDKLDLWKSTLVYFTSDHGAHIDLGTNGGSNKPFKGGKGMGAIEGGIRVPAMIRLPEKFQKDKLYEIKVPTTLMDFLPTVKEILDEEKEPNREEVLLPNQIDGRSFLSLVKGRTKSPHKFIRHYCGTSLHALRLVTNENVYKAWFKRPILNENGHCGEYQLCSCFGNSSVLQDFGCDIEIFDLAKDPTEITELSKNSEIYNELKWKFLHEHIRINNNINDLLKCEIDNHPNGDFKGKTSGDEIRVVSQFTTFLGVMARPWMQPCARFPFCSTKC